jgi:thermitase
MNKKCQIANDKWNCRSGFAIRHSSFVILVCLLLSVCFNAAAQTNSLIWNAAANRVDADVRDETLIPLLQQISRDSGVYLEPGTTRTVSAKFRNLPSTDALHRLLDGLNFSLSPQTNAPAQLYVFSTKIQNATQLIQAEAPAHKHVSDQLMVRVKPGTDIDALAKSVGAKIVGRMDGMGIYLLQFASAADADAALAKLRADSDVLDVDYNYYFDPEPSALPLTAASLPQGPVALKLNPQTPGDPCNVVIGLIDTPINSLGASLDPFLLKAISVAGDSTGGAPGENSVPTHATGMAETILRAISQSGGGSTSARILPVDVYGDSEMATSWNVALGIQAAVDNGANVLNLSLGSSGNSSVLDSVIQQAIAAGIPIFAAAGNTPVNTPTYPAAISGVNAVTALQQKGQIASYANYGSFVDMALPGANIVYLGSQAYLVEGTSVSTAYATGIAAGTKTSNCNTWPQIQSAMQQQFAVPQK